MQCKVKKLDNKQRINPVEEEPGGESVVESGVDIKVEEIEEEKVPTTTPQQALHFFNQQMFDLKANMKA